MCKILSRKNIYLYENLTLSVFYKLLRVFLGKYLEQNNKFVFLLFYYIIYFAFYCKWLLFIITFFNVLLFLLFHLFITVFIYILNYFLRTFPLTRQFENPFIYIVTKRWYIFPSCAISISPSSHLN